MLMFATAIIFFTRLPLWRYISVPSQNFQRVIYYWSFSGWLTASTMILTLWLFQSIFPYSIAVILTIVARVLLTGALHEDGLADFLDGFGGGNTKDKILSIMKDSHAGTYAILGLILYFLLLDNILLNIPFSQLPLFIFIADPFCKMLSSFITLRLPYARTVETSKIQAVYIPPRDQDILASITFGLLPLCILSFALPSFLYLLAIIPPIVLFFMLTSWMKHKIQGYTGDCIGALFLLLELSMLLAYLALVRIL